MPSRIRFIDGFGRVVSSFAVGERAGIRVEDHNLDDPLVRGTVSVSVRAQSGGIGDSESVTLTETGYDTNVFEGSIPLDPPPFSGLGNSRLSVSPGDVLHAEHGNLTTPAASVVEASVSGSQVLFVDANGIGGKPATVYLEGSQAWVRVVDLFANQTSSADSVSVTLRTTLGPDVEQLTLTETGGATGVFTGSIPLAVSNLNPNDGWLTTVQDAGTPHEYDTLRAEYNGAVATAGTISSRTWFVDAYGNPVESYPRGSRAYIRVEDHTADRPGLYDTVQVTLRSLSIGDQETVTLLETTRDSGIFAGSLPLETSSYGQTYPYPGDGKLQSDAGEEIEAVHTDWTGATASSDKATIDYASVEFIDEAGVTTFEVLEGGVARLRVFDPLSNGGSGPTYVRVESRYGDDQEYVQLAETTYQSHIFEGTIQLRSGGPGGGLPGNNLLETSTSGNPEYRPEELTAFYSGQAVAIVRSSRVRFIDGFGQVVSSFAVGERAGVRVEDHNLDDPLVRGTVQVNVQASNGDAESVTLTETGYDTNVFEGSIATAPGSPAGSNGTLQVQPGQTIEARHGNTTTPNATVAQATITGGTVMFVDAAGQPATVYLEGSRAWVRVADFFANQSSGVDSVTVTLRTTLGPDVEFLTLTETGGATGVFTGSIPLRVSTMQPNDGWLTTVQDAGTPHEYDTLRAEYNGAVATVGTISSRTWFVDAAGNPVESYARGSRLFLRVEDHTADRPGLYDTVQVTVRSLFLGDQETVALLETTRDSGIFAGSLPLETSSYGQTYPYPGDGKLQSDAGEEIEAAHTDWTGATTSTDRATIDYASVEFVDEAGITTFEVLEGGLARVRLYDLFSSPYSSPPSVRVESRYGQDREYVQLTETTYQSHIFEGTIQLRSGGPGGGLQGNNILETSTSGNPEYRPEELTAYYSGQAVAIVRPSRVRFIDGFGQVVSSFAVGERAGVRVEDHNLDDPLVRGTVQVNVQASNGDVESVTLTETGYDTNLYEGSIPTGAGTPANSNGTLQVQPGLTIEARHGNMTTPNATVAQAAITGATVLFVNAAGTAGQPAEVYLEGSRAYVQVASFFANQSSAADSLTVTLRTTLGPDVEQLTLIETGPATGVFTGSIPLRVSTLQPNDGWLTTVQDPGTPHEYDTLRAEYNGAVATIGTISSRTWFVDAYGNPVESYASGSRAYIRVEDHTADRPGLYDTVQVTARSLFTGDQETVTLLETTRDSGIFAGSLPLETSSYGQTYPNPGDGKLQSNVNEEIEAVHTDWTGSTTSADRATIDYSSVEFIDEAGITTFEVLEGGLARLRVFMSTYGSSPTVRVESRYSHDQEYVQLTETAYQSRIFEGTIQLRSGGPGGGLPGNNLLETSTSGNPEYRPEELTAYYSGQAVAVVRPSRVRFIDGFGQEVSSFAAGDQVGVRVEDHNLDDPLVRGTVQVNVQASNGDVESVTLTETGYDTNVYEGSIASGTGTPASGNGALQVLPGLTIEARHGNMTTPNATVAQAAITGATVLFVDAAGQPASVYLEGSRAWVRVVDVTADQTSSADSLAVTLRTTLGPDVEQLTLLETGPSTGVFTGSIPLRVSTLSPNDGWLTTVQDAGTPHEYDTLRAEHNGAVATIATLSSRTWFIDASGRPVDGYARGARAYVRVEDHTADQSAGTDTVQVTLRSLSTGDLESLTLPEVSGGGVFEGSLALETSVNGQTFPTQGDGKLQADANEEIEAVHIDWTGSTQSSDRADILYGAVEFVDPSGQITAELIEGGAARLRVFDLLASTPNSSLPTVRVSSRYGNDQEYVQLVETGYQTHVFEGTIQLRSSGPGGGLQGNNLLETSTSGNPEYRQEVVTASYINEAVAVAVPSRVWFLGDQGEVVTEYAVGSPVRVRVEDHNAGSAGQVDSVTVNLTTPTDSESVALTETGADTGIYEGSAGIDAAPGVTVTAEHGNLTTPNPTRAQAVFTDNHVPLAVNDSAQTEEVPVTIPVLANDSDPDSEPLQVASVTQGAHGAVAINGDQTVTYTPTAGFTGTDTFTYVASDPRGGRSQATVTVAVISANHPPTPAADSATTQEDQAVDIAVLANDTDPDNDTLQVVSVSVPANGTAELQPNGSVTFTPAADWNGQTSFSYTVRDPDGLTASATVTVTVTPVNDPPVANDDAASVAEDGSVIVTVKTNDTDVEGDALDVTAVTSATHGAAVLNADDTVTYTPAANYSGTDSFTYTLSDGHSGTDTATVTVTVTPANDAPVGEDDTATTQEDTPVTIDVLANDSDPDGDVLDVTYTTGVIHGYAVVNADNTITFTPAQDYSGTVTFSYAYTDGTDTGYADVTVTIESVNDAPVAVDDSTEVAEDSSATVWVLTNDSDADNDTLDVTAVTQGAHGEVVLNADDTVTYTPAADFHGSDSFTYTVSDGNGGNDTGTVTVTVVSANDAPTAADDTATMSEDTPVTVSVLANDTDIDNDTLTVSAVTQGTNGSVAILGSQVTYTPNANFHGTDSFTYTANDGNGGTDTATVTVTINPTNDAPVADDDAASVVEDDSAAVAVLGNDSDVDGDTLTVTAVTQGAHGAVAITGSTVTYTPASNYNGADAFTYTISDGNGGSDTATVTMTVTASNDALTANDDSATAAEDGSVTVNVLANDTDPENDPLTVVSVTQGTNGAVAIVGNQVTYTPNADFHGTDSFTYTASDGNGGTGGATVTVTVTPVNDAPVAGDDTASVVEDGSVTISVLGDDTDVDGDTLIVASVTQGTNGTVVIVGSSQVTYTPATNFHGTDSFTYTVSDGNGGTDTANVAVTVGAANDAPVANGDSASTSEDTAVTVNVLANDTDLDGDTLSVASVTQGANGAVTISGTQVVYTPGANYNGSDSFTYTASDGNGGSATATVTVTVTPVNDAPVAVADSASVAEDGSVSVSVLANDTDVDGDSLTLLAVTQGAHGSVAISGSQAVYTPAANYNGPDSFTYTVRDGNGGNAVGTVTVTVTGTNDAPVAVNDSASVAEDGSVVVSVRSNDSDLDGDTLTITAVTQGANGSVTHNGSTVTYTPNANFNGSNSFTYTISDGNGGTATASVAVTITPVNDPPVAVNDTATTLAEVAVTVNVRANDTDIDSPTLTVTAATQGAHGSVSISSEVGVTYTPAAGWVGPDSFTYTISDGSGGTATATVNVTVQAPARVTGNLQVLYTFYEGSGTLVHDVSGVGTPYNLTIGSASAVTWLPGALSLNTSVLVQNTANATKVINACKSSNEVTMEAWVAPDNTTQTGPAAIASIAQNTTKRDVTLGQSGTSYNGQLKTSTTGNDGTQTSTGAVATTGLTHVVYTRSSTGAVRIYVNGTQVATATLTGNLSGWSNYSLALGGEPNGARYWVGDMHLVAIYSRALTAAEARQNWLAGAN
ncbi:MAG: Ig-like domain-containing protein [Acidobacteriota bacterium]